MTAGALFKQAAPGVVKIIVFDADGKPYASGSGFVVGETGQIATNYHVIRGAHRGTVRFASGAEADITGVLGFDRSHDVALVQSAEPYAKPLSLAHGENLHEGDSVFAVGSPEGLDNSLSEGIISGFRRSLIQITAPISHGSSGGPVFDSRGQVVGLSTAMLVGSGIENLNFAVPVSFLEPYLANRTSRPLTVISEENSGQSVIFHGYIGLGPRDKRVMPFVVDASRMSMATLRGSYHSKGGLGGAVHMVLARDNVLVRDYGENTYREVSEKLPAGRYSLIIYSDRAVLLSRDVDADFNLTFVQ